MRITITRVDTGQAQVKVDGRVFPATFNPRLRKWDVQTPKGRLRSASAKLKSIPKLFGKTPARTSAPVVAAKAPPAKAPRGAPQDMSVEAYTTRLLSAMERTCGTATEALRCATYVGQDVGHGWVILGTDGRRALTRKATPEDKPEPTKRPVLHDADPPFTFAITAAFEDAIRRARRGLTDTKQHPGTVQLAVDGRRRTVTVRSLALSAPIVVPVTGKVTTRTITCNPRLLAEAFGRGGTLGYQRKADAALVLDTNDGLRYVLMPIRMPAATKKETK